MFGTTGTAQSFASRCFAIIREICSPRGRSAALPFLPGRAWVKEQYGITDTLAADV